MEETRTRKFLHGPAWEETPLKWTRDLGATVCFCLFSVYITRDDFFKKLPSRSLCRRFAFEWRFFFLDTTAGFWEEKKTKGNTKNLLPHVEREGRYTHQVPLFYPPGKNRLCSSVLCFVYSLFFLLLPPVFSRFHCGMQHVVSRQSELTTKRRTFFSFFCSPLSVEIEKEWRRPFGTRRHSSSSSSTSTSTWCNTSVVRKSGVRFLPFSRRFVESEWTGRLSGLDNRLWALRRQQFTGNTWHLCRLWLQFRRRPLRLLSQPQRLWTSAITIMTRWRTGWSSLRLPIPT